MHILFSYTQRLLLFILYNVMHMIYSSPVSAPWHCCSSFQVCSFQPLSFAGWTRFRWLGPKHCRYDCFCKYFSALCRYLCLRVVFIADLDHLSFCSLIVLFPSTVFRCKIFWCRWWVPSFLWCRPWAYDQFFFIVLNSNSCAANQVPSYVGEHHYKEYPFKSVPFCNFVLLVYSTY